MKKMMRRALGAALSLVMLTGLLSGCGAAADPVKEVMGYSGSTVLFTVNGNDVTAGDYFFWMAQNVDSATGYYSSMGMEMDWTQKMDGEQTVDDYVKESAQETAILYNVVAAKAAEGGYEMTDEDKAAYQEDMNSAIEQMGGEEEYQKMLQTMCVTEETMEKLSSVGVLYSHMSDGMFHEGGEYAATPEVIAKYVEDSDLLCAKHILLTTSDVATGEDLTAEKAAEKKATAEDLAAQLQAITDPEELASKFDELMNQYTEDPGTQSNPDGYVFTAGQMVPEFEDATRALEIGQVSGVVKSDYGYHIILRQNPADSSEVQSQWQDEQMDAILQQWIDEAEVETTETYDNLTTADFYEKLTAYREKINPAEDAEEAEGAQDAEEATQEEETAPAEETQPAEQETVDTETDAAEETPAE